MSTTYYKMINVFGIQLRYPENLTKRKKEKRNRQGISTKYNCQTSIYWFLKHFLLVDLAQNTKNEK